HSYPPISSQASTELRPAASVIRLPACPAISITRMPRSKYSGSDCRTCSNFSGYSAASIARPTPVASTPAGYFLFINKIPAAPIDPSTTAFRHPSIALPPEQPHLFAIVPQRPPVAPNGAPLASFASFILPSSLEAPMYPSHIRRTAFILIVALATTLSAQTKPSARALGVPFAATPGPNNAITDVKGVEVGHTTLISGEGKLEIGKGPVRTGVTAIHPRGKASNDAGFLNGPVMITNTHSVGVVRDAVIAWKVKHGSPDMEGYWWSLPVVAETWDGYLNDINGFHVKPEDAFHALDVAHSGPVEEGSVGGGTGMICNEFKGGI